jgi:hypothetical protein
MFSLCSHIDPVDPSRTDADKTLLLHKHTGGYFFSPYVPIGKITFWQKSVSEGVLVVISEKFHKSPGKVFL